MALLTIVRPGDFTLAVESTAFAKSLERAAANLGEEALTGRYDWSDPRAIVIDGEGTGIRAGDPGARALFFDNTAYGFWIEFDDPSRLTAPPRVLSVSREIEEAFTYHGKRGILSGTIDFGNDIGHAKLELTYSIDGRPRVFTFRFEVLSQKLDYHRDWRLIVSDVERAYSMLSADYFKKASHSFGFSSRREAPEVIWWSLFESLQERFIGACRLVLSRPRRRVVPSTEPLRADQLRRLTPALEDEWARFRRSPGHRYAGRLDDLSQDTPANRFVKHALGRVRRRHERLANHLLACHGERQVTSSMAERIESTRRRLRGLCANPFFQGVGPYEPVAQESFVLRRAPGYAAIARCYAMLEAAYALQEGAFELQTKDIATLYEIWCLIQVRDIVAEKLAERGGEGLSIEDADRGELAGRFIGGLGKGRRSRILFREGDALLAEVSYNPETTLGESAEAIPGTVSPTGVGQRPDIVLQLSRELGAEKGFRLTYLFDAKYRIDARPWSLGDELVDRPPQDAINQMHRFRDAIYYESKDHDLSPELKKEVVGGYILFPGAGGQAAVREAPFFRSIDQVNIGAFPLRPGSPESRELLASFIGGLLREGAPEQLEAVVPQKGTFQVLERDRADVIAPEDERDAFLRAEANAELREAALAAHLYIAPMGTVEKPDAVRWILLPVPNHPVCLLKVLARPGDNLSGAEIARRYPEFARTALVKRAPSDLFLTWEVEPLDDVSRRPGQ